MANFSLEQIATYRLVISRGSFTAAADMLGISQPAVSAQVKQLEDALQVKLIERTGKGIRPTDAGEKFLVHCIKIEKEVVEAIQSMAWLKSDISGKAILGTGATLCIHLLPDVLRDLRERYPRLQVGVTTANTQDIVRAVEDNRIDIGLVTLPAKGRHLDISPVMEDEFVAIIPADAADYDDLASNTLPLIAFESGSSSRYLLDEWFLAKGEKVQPVMELGSIEAVKRMVRSGLGYSIVPRIAVSSDQDREGLVIRSLKPALYRTIAIVMRQDKTLNRNMTTIIRSIQWHISQRHSSGLLASPRPELLRAGPAD